MADSTSRFGFVAFAETWNGRLAMLGFVIGLGLAISWLSRLTGPPTRSRP